MRIHIAVIMMGLAANVCAGEAGWSDAAAVLALEANQQGRFTLRLDSKENISGCRKPDGYYADYGRAGSELMYKTALEALQHALKVQVYATGVCDLEGNSEISSIRLLP